MAYETDEWPYRQAANHGVKRTGAPRHIVLHSTESEGTARAIWEWFAEPGDKGSAHVTAGQDGIFQSVYDSYVPHAAPGANHDGMHIEFVGRAKWSRSEWLRRDETLRNGASVAAQYALKYRLPLTRLSRDGLSRNYKGVCIHDDVSKVFKRSTHWDTGTGFPMDLFLEYAVDEYDRRSGVAPPPIVLDPLPPFDYHVAFVWDGAPEEGVANMLRVEHDIRSVHRADETFVGIRVNLGFEEGPRGEGLVAVNAYKGESTRGAGRRETAAVANRILHDGEFVESLRKKGRELSAARALGQLS